MIAKTDMMSVLLEGCPSFSTKWESSRDEWRQEADDPPLYLFLADFARHLIGMVERGEKAVLVAVFTAVERLLVEGDPDVREATVVGLLEDLQNLNLHPNGTAPEQFLPYLGPASARWWAKLDRFWQHGELLTDDDGAAPAGGPGSLSGGVARAAPAAAERDRSAAEWFRVNEVPAEAWGRMIGFYRKLIDEYGFHQTPMLEFVSWLAASPYSRVLYPSTSHAALGLSAVPTFEQRLRQPMVYIAYADPTGFAIHWQRGQGDEVREELVPSPKAPEVFDRILEWLGLPERRLAEPAAGSDGG